MTRRLPAWVRALGVGNLLVALFWAALGWNQFRDVGTKSLMLVVSQGVAEQAKPQPEQEHPLTILSWSSPPPERTLARPRAPTRITRPEPPPVVAAALTGGFRADIAEITRQSWAALTAGLAGALAVCGLSLFLEDKARRRMRSLLWAGAVVFASGLVVARYTVFAKQHDWIGVAISLSQSRRVWCGFIGIATVIMAILGSFALRASRTAATWNSVAMASVFGGTLVTLSALAVLIQYAGFPPLPSWIYGAIALGQSSWAWILLVAAPRLRALPDAAPFEPANATRSSLPTNYGSATSV